MKKKRRAAVKSKTRKANIPLRRRLKLIYLRSVFLSKCIVIAFTGIFLFTQYFADTKHEIMQNIYELTGDIGFKLENVIIEGQENTSESDILEVLNADTGTPIFALNLDKIREDLRVSSWIKDAYVGRRLPGSLYIKLFERVPIAIWQINHQLFLIDEDGYKISKDIQKFSHLLQVVGVDANIYAGRLVDTLKKYPSLAPHVISAVRYGDRRWDLNFQENITVKMPTQGFEESLKYINALNKVNKLFDQNYKTIDLRDTEKYYLLKHQEL